MTLNEMDFFKNPWTEEFTIKSVLIAVLRDARNVTGRDLDTGEKLNKHHGSWLGALGYLVIVDQLSSIFQINYAPKNTECSRTFINYLRFFFSEEELSYKDACTLYSLRCSLAHNYSLFNIPENTSQKCKDMLTKHFSLNQDKEQLIIHPKVEWDGTPENKTACTKTKVSLELLGDLIEKLIERVSKKVIEKSQEITIDKEKLIFIQHR